VFRTVPDQILERQKSLLDQQCLLAVF
jgi:hypothetical protein